MLHGDQGRRIAAAVGWGVATLAVARVPAAVAALPALGLLSGPLGAGLALLASVVALAHALEGRAPAWRPPAPALFLAAAVAFALAGTHYATRLRVSGDEPHYLLMAQSLWREGDLDLRDNFARGDWREYLPALPAPHYAAPRRDGRPYPGHSPGLPALLAPFYAAGGRLACVLVLALLAAALTLEVRALALRATGQAGAALWAWVAAAGPPVLFYSFHLYTEVPSALAAALALRLLLGPCAPPAAALAAAAAAALPWLHVKMAPAAGVLGLVGALRLRGRSRVVFLAVALLSAALYLGYYQSVFGRPTPLAAYGGVPRDVAWEPLRAAAGMLLDRSFGLLPIAPLLLLALAGLPGGTWRSRGSHLLLGAAVLAPPLLWRMWWGGQCPPGRLLVPAVPVLAVALAARLAAGPHGLARWRAALAGIGLGLAALALWRPESMLLLNRRDRPARLLDALSPEGGVQLGRYLPSLVYPRPEEARVAWLWLAALALLLALDALASRQKRVDRLFRGLGLPLVLLATLSLAVDRWARRPGVPGVAAPPASTVPEAAPPTQPTSEGEEP